MSKRRSEGPTWRVKTPEEIKLGFFVLVRGIMEVESGSGTLRSGGEVLKSCL